MCWRLVTTCGALLLAIASVTLAAPGPNTDCAPFGYLHQKAYAVDCEERLPLEPYHPQPGDIILASHTNLVWTTAYGFARTGKPGHSAIVHAMPDGSLAVLEAGSFGKAVVAVTPLCKWLRCYPGIVWVRRRKFPLDAEQSARLTEFALCNDGKPYAILRLLAQLTPFKTRGYFRTAYIGKPNGIRSKYFCSEIVLESLVYAGLLDPETTRPTATYPRDIFYDSSLNPYINSHLLLKCSWMVPALFSKCPCGHR